MQKDRPVGRLSMDRHEVSNSYAEGFSAGFEAGRRTSLAEGTQKRISIDANHQKSSSQDRRPFASARHTPTKDIGKTSNNGRKSFDESHDDHIRNQEHGIKGQITNPSTTVHFQSRGHY